MSQEEQLALIWDDVQIGHIAGFKSFHPRCQGHNWCFYCKDLTIDNYRLCNHCAAERAIRKGKMPSMARLPQYYARPIMKFMDLSRDVVDLICRFLPKIDQVMWAVSCHARFRPNPKFLTQARVLDHWNQFGWFLDHDCVTDVDYELNYNFNYIVEHRDLGLIRQYYTMAKPYMKTNLLNKLEISNMGLDQGDTDFFKWVVLQTKYKMFDLNNIMAYIIKANDSDLLEWLFKNTANYCVRWMDLEQIVNLRMDKLCKTAKLYPGRVRNGELAGDLLKAGDWDSLTFLKE